MQTKQNRQALDFLFWFSFCKHVSCLKCHHSIRIKAKNKPTVHNIFEYFCCAIYTHMEALENLLIIVIIAAYQIMESGGSLSKRDSNNSNRPPTFWFYELRSAHNFGHGLKVFKQVNMLYNSTKKLCAHSMCFVLGFGWCFIDNKRFHTMLISILFSKCKRELEQVDKCLWNLATTFFFFSSAKWSTFN